MQRKAQHAKRIPHPGAGKVFRRPVAPRFKSDPRFGKRFDQRQGGFVVAVQHGGGLPRRERGKLLHQVGILRLFM